MKVLVVDDSDVSLFLLDNWLRRSGYEVHTARNGLEALEILEIAPVDVIVSDALMPQMDGFELCYRVKSNPRTHHIPFLFCSADYIAPMDEQFAFKVGASRYIVKTDDPAAFIRELELGLQHAAEVDHRSPASSPLPEQHYLREYTERLINKLGEKAGALEVINEHLTEKNHKLEEANRLKDDFIAVVSHELRSPLAAIIGFSEMLQAPNAAPLIPEQTEIVDIILQRANDLHGLIEELLEFGALKAGQRPFRPRWTSLQEAIRAATESMYHQLQLSGLRLDVAVEPVDLELEADQAALRRVLIILLDNANKFTPAGGRITVEASEEAGRVSISVRDTGIGMPADKLEVIFDSFRQLEGHIARSYQGVGLGLAIARRLVAMHGGRIWAASEQGKGSTFTVVLPQRQDLHLELAAPVASPTAPEISAPGPGGTETILLVDDDEAMCTIMGQVLQEVGYKVLEASSGQAALELCNTQQEPIHLLLTDVAMPGMTGPELATCLASQTPTLAVLFVTGNATHDSSMRQALALPRRSLLAKPFSGERLLHEVRKVLSA